DWRLSSLALRWSPLQRSAFWLPRRTSTAKSRIQVRDRGSTWRLFFCWFFSAVLYSFIYPTLSSPLSEAASRPVNGARRKAATSGWPVESQVHASARQEDTCRYAPFFAG